MTARSRPSQSNFHAKTAESTTTMKRSGIYATQCILGCSLRLISRRTSTMAIVEKETMQVSLCASWPWRKRNMILSRLLPCAAAEWVANVSRPISGMSWSTRMVMPMALMKPRRKGRERTLSRKPKRQSPARRITPPASPVTMPATWAFLSPSSSA